MKINNKEISKELLAKAMTSETPEELMKLAAEAGINLTKEQAQAFLEEMDEVDLSSDQLQQVAGGGNWAPLTCSTRDQMISLY